MPGAASQEAFQLPGGVANQEWAEWSAVNLQAPMQDLRGSGEQQDRPAVLDPLLRGGVGQRPAPQGNDPVLPGCDQPVQLRPFALAETGFALFGENARDRAAALALDLSIQVIKR